MKIFEDNMKNKKLNSKNLVNFDNIFNIPNIIKNIKTTLSYQNKILNDKEIQKFKNNLYSKLNISNKYDLFWMSSEYDVYECIISSIIKSYINITKRKPHIICNSTENKYIKKLLNFYKDKNIITFDFCKCNIYGSITSSEMEQYVTENTCLLISSFINMHTGAINNMKLLGEISHKFKIPVFCDTKFLIGKYPISPDKNNIDIFNITFDIGPINANAICIKKSLLDGYKLLEYEPKYNISKNLNIIDRSGNIIISKYLNHIYKSKEFLKTENNKIIEKKKLILKQLKSNNINISYYDEIIKNIINNKTSNKVTNKFKKNDIIIINSSKSSLTTPYLLTFLLPNSKITFTKLKNKLEDFNIFILPQDKNIYSHIGINKKWLDKIFILYLSSELTNSKISYFTKKFVNILI